MYMQHVFLSAVKKQGQMDTERDTLGGTIKKYSVGQELLPF